MGGCVEYRRRAEAIDDPARSIGVVVCPGEARGASALLTRRTDSLPIAAQLDAMSDGIKRAMAQRKASKEARGSGCRRIPPSPRPDEGTRGSDDVLLVKNLGLRRRCERLSSTGAYPRWTPRPEHPITSAVISDRHDKIVAGPIPKEVNMLLARSGKRLHFLASHRSSTSLLRSTEAFHSSRHR